MKRVIILALGAVFASLLLVGCAGDSVAIGDTVRLVNPDGTPIEMYEAASPSAAVGVTVPVDEECEVLSGPRTAANITFWKLECSIGMDPNLGVELHFAGWVDAAKFEALD